MNPLLQAWLAPTLEEGLRIAYDTLNARTLQSEITSFEVEQYRYTSSCISIHLKRARSLQIVDYNSRRKHPFDVTLSDGQTKIRALFNKDSTKRIVSSKGSPFTEGTLGGIIGITEYFVTFNPRNDFPKRFMLEIEHFKLLGSEGSGTIGSPFDIEEVASLRSIEQQLTSLMSLREGRQRDILQSPQIAHLATDASPRSTTDPATQTDFSTQVLKHVSSMQPAARQADTFPIGNRAALLNTLSGFGGAKRIDRKADQPKKLCGENTVALLKPDGNVLQNTLSQTVSCQNMTPTPANLEVMQCSDKSQQPQSSLQPSSGPIDAKSDECSASIARILPRQPDQSEQEHDCVRTQCAPPVQRGTVLDRVCDDSKAFAVPLVEQNKDPKPFEGFRRIPRSHIRVPESQRTMLERTDSWSHCESNAYPAYLDVPPEVLQGLRAFLNKAPSTECEEQIEEECDYVRPARRAMHDSSITTLKGPNDRADRENQFSISKRSLDAAPEFICDKSEPFEVLTDPKVSSKIPFPIDHIDDCSDLTDDEQLSWPTTPARSLTPDSRVDSPCDLKDLPRMSHSSPLNGIELIAGPSQSPSLGLSALHTRETTLQGKKCKVSDYTFPSSSLDAENELELDVPYAVGDHINEPEFDPDMEDPVETAHDLPSTAGYDIVQVEQTPYHNQRLLEREDEDQSPLRQLLPSFWEQQRVGDSISSDPIIPATFDDSRCLVRDTTTAQLHELSNEGRRGVDEALEEDNLAKNQLFEELRFSQQDPRDQGHMHIEAEESISFNEAIPTKFKTNTSIISMGTALRNSGAFSASNISMDDECRQVRDPTRLDANFKEGHALKRGNVGINKDVRQPLAKRLCLRKPLILDLSQGEDIVVNTKDMSWANRQIFSHNPSSTVFTAPAEILGIDSDGPTKPPGGAGTPGISDIPIALVAKSEGTDSTTMYSLSLPQKTSLQWEYKPDSTKLNDVTLATVKRNPKHESILNHTPSRSMVRRTQPVLQKFRSVYPTYTGSEKRFTEAICYIDWLGAEKKRRPDQYYWDSIIQVLAKEYLQYASKTRNADIMLSGVDFFFRWKEGRDLDFDEIRIITELSIKEAISFSDPTLVQDSMARLSGLNVAFSRSTRSINTTPVLTTSSPLGQRQVSARPDSSSDRVHTERESLQGLGYISSSRTTVPRRHYFETHSQMHTAQGLSSQRSAEDSDLVHGDLSPSINASQASRSPSSNICRGAGSVNIVGGATRTSTITSPRHMNTGVRRTKSMPYKDPDKAKNTLTNQDIASTKRKQSEFSTFVKLRKEKGLFPKTLTPKTSFCTKRVECSAKRCSPSIDHSLRKD